MSLIQEILYTLSNYPGGYRILYNIIYDSQPPGKYKKKSFENTLRVTLSRMKKNGLLAHKKQEWAITPEGHEFLNSRKAGIKKFFPNRNSVNINQLKRLIIIFDIPEKKRKYRDWLRVGLVSFGFEQIQKSVWFGPFLPKEFIQYLDEIGILKYIRFFKAAEKDLI
jgi:DNA-binding transcriptional regulator PaaX